MNKLEKSSFDSIEDSKNNIENIIFNLKIKINKLNEIYNDMLKNSLGNKLLIVCLDSFFFQKLILNKNVESLVSIKNIIYNRFYCDYYKLLKKINNYIKTNLNNKDLLNNLNNLKNEQDYPKYNDLAIYQFYSFDLTKKMFEEIIDKLLKLYEYHEIRNKKLKKYNSQEKIGLNINNFVSSFENANNSVKNKIDLFKNYLFFYLCLHKNYLKKFHSKILLLYDQVNKDINLDIKTNTSSDTVSNLVKNIVKSNNTIIQNFDLTNTLSNTLKK